jgi:DNA-binding NtrC family response regulator
MLYLILAERDIMPSNLIMVIDDDEDLRDLYVESLKSKGLRVKGSSDAKVALDEISDEPQKYSLVISDIMMAAMNGSILANKGKRNQ